MTAQIIFSGDSSVGIFPWSFTMELDENMKEQFTDYPEYRQQLRDKIKAFYLEMDGEGNSCHVYFSDEVFE